MKIKTKPEMMRLATDIITGMWVTSSTSEPGIAHITIEASDGTVLCTCKGGQLQNKCWHITKIKDEN